MDELWKARLDDRYDCTVFRKAEYTGILTVTDSDGTILLNEDVPLSFGAVFGVDTLDIQDWQARILEVVDE